MLNLIDLLRANFQGCLCYFLSYPHSSAHSHPIMMNLSLLNYFEFERRLCVEEAATLWRSSSVLNPMENSMLLSFRNYNNIEMLWDSFWCELYRISHKRRKEQLSGFILTLPQQSRNYWFFSDFLIRDWMWRAFFFSQYFIYFSFQRTFLRLL